MSEDRQAEDVIANLMLADMGVKTIVFEALMENGLITSDALAGMLANLRKSLLKTAPNVEQIPARSESEHYSRHFLAKIIAAFRHAVRKLVSHGSGDTGIATPILLDGFSSPFFRVGDLVR